jgi:hypothetical protein
MIRVVLRRAQMPEELQEENCGICGVCFEVETVVAQIVGAKGGSVCPPCVEYLHQRNPHAFPSTEEHEAALRRFPMPIWSSVEEAARVAVEDEAVFWRAYDAGRLTTRA